MIDDPNVILPLATSYNERGVAGFTHAVTNGEDQRKINCFYELSKNPVTGKGTLALSKRPGVTISSSPFAFSADNAQTAFLMINAGASYLTSDLYTVINKDTNNNIRSAVASSGNVTISSAGAFLSPVFIDTTAISNVPNVVLQLRNTSNGSQSAFFINNTNLQAGNPWTEISSASASAMQSLLPIGKIEHLDGFANILTASNKIMSSDSNSLLGWSAGSFITKQIKQDRPVGLARLSNKIVAFGEETAEVFYNAGNTVGSPLGRIPQLHTRVGLVGTTLSNGTHYYCTIGEKIYFIGRNSQGNSCALFSFDGNSFIKLGTEYLNKILSEKSASIFSVNSVIFNGLTMVAICLSAPGASPQVSLVYSPEWNEVFEWDSSVFSPVNSGRFYLGIGSNGNRVYTFDGSDNWQDNGTSYEWLTQFRVPSNGSSRKRMAMYGVDADTDTSANSISVDVSDDDCQSFYSLQSLDLTQDRKINFRGGSFRKRHVRLSATDARPKRIHNFLARID